jgi:hypothetical protein
MVFTFLAGIMATLKKNSKPNSFHSIPSKMAHLATMEIALRFLLLEAAILFPSKKNLGLQTFCRSWPPLEITSKTAHPATMENGAQIIISGGSGEKLFFGLHTFCRNDDQPPEWILVLKVFYLKTANLATMENALGFLFMEVATLFLIFSFCKFLEMDKMSTLKLNDELGVETARAQSDHPFT